ncbi:hypothetical protein IJH97_02975 [Candidatus Saccharibacteria bacterium]|nr:hypothetical protein [Candidatus Saccharibacteria bacterium]
MLKKYELQLDLTTGPGKKEYSDVAMRTINYLQDPVEKSHYEQLVAKRLGVSVEALKRKKLSTETHRFKTVKTNNVASDTLKSLENNLLAIMLYGGSAGSDIKLEIPTDDTRMAELEFIFDQKYAKWSKDDLAAEAVELNTRYQKELKKQQKILLQKKLEQTDDEEAVNQILREIKSLDF